VVNYVLPNYAHTMLLTVYTTALWSNKWKGKALTSLNFLFRQGETAYSGVRIDFSPYQQGRVIFPLRASAPAQLVFFPNEVSHFGGERARSLKDFSSKFEIAKTVHVQPFLPQTTLGAPLKTRDVLFPAGSSRTIVLWNNCNRGW